MFRRPKLLCEDCNWIGHQEDCVKEYTIYEELELYCPKCGSINLIELIDREARLLVPA